MPHLPILIRAASALVGFADAEDAAQEALLRAWHAWPELQELAAVRRWLLRIVYNVCLDWQRGRFGTHRRRTESLTDTTALPGLFDDDPGSSDHATSLDLRQAITALDEPLRQVIVLRFYAGLDATEIGAALTVSPNTVRSRLQRALTQLKSSLAYPDASLSLLHVSKGKADV